jgi:2-keto-3-deoxy-L-rhamnonate aldolase RhmA
MNTQPDGAGRSVAAPLLALIVKVPSASTVELAGHAGFDFVLIDTEHGPSDMGELEHHVRAADSAGIRSLVRVSGADSADILRALDAGANGIVVPHVTSAADVRCAVARTRYPPNGRRSLALSTRAGRHGTRPVAEHVAAGADVLLIAQLEDAEALGQLPEILDTDGLAGVFIGPADLSASLGRPGQLDHPVVSGAIERITAAVLERPQLWLSILAADEEEARTWIGRGARLIFLNAPALLATRLLAIAETLHTYQAQGASAWQTTTP